ncbi:hypothetical protein CC80DRAFT_23586 [Byssothecium circinans]|uniref:Uncharacterized protein n=1 Tax=Byssothecium circinans TaxID=147558 RepID=A0A6A5U2Q2_9PLEO|nr:hypothetical protein CC80DRAFT_23586 [Byssothecium circinans]
MSPLTEFKAALPPLTSLLLLVSKTCAYPPFFFHLFCLFYNVAPVRTVAGMEGRIGWNWLALSSLTLFFLTLSVNTLFTLFTLDIPLLCFAWVYTGLAVLSSSSTSSSFAFSK